MIAGDAGRQCLQSQRKPPAAASAICLVQSSGVRQMVGWKMEKPVSTIYTCYMSVLSCQKLLLQSFIYIAPIVYIFNIYNFDNLINRI